jgi:hypothetical protein
VNVVIHRDNRVLMRQVIVAAWPLGKRVLNASLAPQNRRSTAKGRIPAPTMAPFPQSLIPQKSEPT